LQGLRLSTAPDSAPADRATKSIGSTPDPIDFALDLLFFAPLGFALEAKRLLPTFVSRGKREVSNARVIGSLVTPIAKRKAERFIAESVRGERSKPKPPKPTHAPNSASAAALLPPFEEPSPSNSTLAIAAPSDDNTTPVSADLISGAVSDVASLPIENYDQLPSSTIVELIDRLNPAERSAVARYEQANRKRRTILTKIGQIGQTGHTSQTRHSPDHTRA
jgi:hypothetical protein